MENFETERLIIRRFIPEDWKDLYDYLSKEEVVKYEPYDVFNEEQSKGEAARRETDPSFWAVCLKDTGKVIGNLYFSEQSPREFQNWELGYVFNSDYHGHGYATEACQCILKYGFEQLNIRRVIAMCNPLNNSSWKLLDRLKMRREGHALQTVFFKRDKDGNPIWHDTYSYAILRTEWINLK